MGLSGIDRANTVERYSNRFKEFGYSPMTLGWDKGKQDIRFEILTSLYNFKNESILDIGCGFGDLNKTLKIRCGENYTYVGVDLVEDLISKAKELYASSNVKFIVGDFLEMDFKEKFSYAISSGIFNHKFDATDSYVFIEDTIRKALDTCTDGIAFDFLSDKVDYMQSHNFHSNPEKILSIAYKYSRNVVLRNDYMPFEFSLFIFKDDSFTEDTVYARYKNSK